MTTMAVKIEEKVGSTERSTKYQFISFKCRERLIEMIFQEEVSIYAAARSLSIHYSTAKAIVRQYKAKGHVFKRKAEMMQKKNSETVVAHPRHEEARLEGEGQNDDQQGIENANQNIHEENRSTFCYSFPGPMPSYMPQIIFCPLQNYQLFYNPYSL